MEKSEKKSMKRSIKELESRFAMLQQQLKAAKVPVIITFDGWGASGKGTLIGKMILNLDRAVLKYVRWMKRTRLKSVIHSYIVIG